MRFDLEDLKPEEATFTLSEKPGVKLTLCKFSLRVQIWTHQHFGKERLEGIFTDRAIPEMAEIVYFMLKDKTEFPTLDAFMDGIVTQADRVSIISALMTSVGVSQPVIEKLAKGNTLGNEPSPSPELTGASSTT